MTPHCPPSALARRPPLSALLVGRRGPKLLVTANIHGPEINPCIISHRIIEWLESAVADGSLQGSVAVFPSLNPTGHRAATRSPSFEGVDPNRYWPDGFAAEPELSADLAEDRYAALYAKRNEPGPTEQCWAKLFELWRAVGFDYHVDLHTAATLSVRSPPTPLGRPLDQRRQAPRPSFSPKPAGQHPFIFVDRVLYREGGGAQEEAEGLWVRLRGMCEALGLSLLAEQPPKQYISAALHRSTSGAVLNGLRVPSVTIECGGMGVAEPRARDGVVEALHNLMRHAGMEAGPIVPQQVVPAHLRLENLHRSVTYPYAPCTGI